MKNPFQYGSKVTGDDFYDRVEIKKSLFNIIDGGNNAVLYGPRRYGKSSLLAQMIAELRGRGAVCVYVNMMNVASLEDFVVSYSKAVYAQAAPKQGALKLLADAFRRLRPSISLGDDGRPSLSFAVSGAKMGAEELREAFALPAKLKPRGRDMVVVLDEFQEVAEFGKDALFERIMRSVIEDQKDVSYVFLGSKAHMLRRMFATPSRPFYRSAQAFSLALPPENESRAFLVARFKSAGLKLSDDLAAELVRLAGNVPYYLQALGSWTFRFVTERADRIVSAQDVQDAFTALYAAERELFEGVFRALPPSQRLVARALAQEPTGTFTEDYRLRHALPTLATVNTAVRRLVADARIDSVGGVYVHVDPLLAHHLRVAGNAGS